MPVFAWPEIDLFHTVRKSIANTPSLLDGSSQPIIYRSKVKLHGTNCAIQIYPNKSVVAQSRATVLNRDNDKYGFARWVATNISFFNQFRGNIFYGEWCGPGVQSDVALSHLDKKIFAIFGSRKLNDTAPEDELISDPDMISALNNSRAGCHVLPWMEKGEVEIDWTASDETLTPQLDKINKMVDSIEGEDPWVKDMFGVSGTGEGLVFYPSNNTSLSNFANFAFKAKGEKHRVLKTKAPAELSVDVASNINNFLDLAVTEARLNQGVHAIESSSLYDIRDTGKFVIWLVEDVMKETKDERAGLADDLVQKAVAAKARNWFLSHAKK